MAEISSLQAADYAAGRKTVSNKALCKKRVLVITSPTTAAWAQGDTIASPVLLPAGTRFGAGSLASHGALGTSVTLDVGIRDKNGTAIDADGIASAVAVASAGRTALNNGALVAAGVDYVTSVPCYVYATLGGANPTDDAQIRLEIEVLLPD